MVDPYTYLYASLGLVPVIICLFALVYWFWMEENSCQIDNLSVPESATNKKRKSWDLEADDLDNLSLADKKKRSESPIKMATALPPNAFSESEVT